jgi:hypothetical protein
MQSGGDIDMSTSTISDCGQIQQNANARHYFGSGGNYIWQNSSSGSLEYRVNSTSVSHGFFVGSLRLHINKDEIELRNPLNMTQNSMREVRRIQSDSSVGFFENSIDMGSSTANMILTAANNFSIVDGTTTVLITSAVKGVEFTRDVSPFTSLGGIYNLGTSSDNWKSLFLDYTSAIKGTTIPAGSAPANLTNYARLFCRDSGAGKMQLRVKFNSTASQLIMEET